MDDKEIARIAKMMHIEIPDDSEYAAQIQKMISYFDILDKADVQDEEILVQETSMDRLRTDRHVRHPDRLIDTIHNYKGRYVRAPGMT